jgi:hypothetical protein
MGLVQDTIWLGEEALKRHSEHGGVTVESHGATVYELNCACGRCLADTDRGMSSILMRHVGHPAYITASNVTCQTDDEVICAAEICFV